jgi:hypothetical protein
VLAIRTEKVVLFRGLLRSIRAQERVDRATLVHCTIAFGNLIERERPRTRAQKSRMVKLRL